MDYSYRLPLVDMPTMKKAFTLFELLIATLIVVLLVGISANAATRAKERALDVEDISNLRQFGIAMTIYQETWGERYDLVGAIKGEYIPKDFLKSKRDQTREGYAIWLAKTQFSQGNKNHPYLAIQDQQLSYLGADAVGLVDDPCVRDITQGSGWLVAFRNLREGVFQPSFGEAYFRLLQDGSVQRRMPEFKNIGNGFGLEVKSLFCENLSQ